jgi:2-deoxy-D-gluconate 3-dehydrogenase
MNGLDLFSLKGKKVLITGADRGIGFSLACALASAGADIVATYRSGDISKLDNFCKENGYSLSVYRLDLANRDNIYATINEIIEKETSIDVLINNAGTIQRKPAADHDDLMWDEVLSINLDAQFILAKAFGKQMVEKKQGKIIFICSLLSFQGGINVPSYTASKSAIAGLIKALSNEWAAFGVNVNGIAPGYIITDNTKALREDEERNASILSRIPCGRWGSPEDLSGAAIFLASSASNYVNGAILVVDGGWLAR